MKTTRITTWKDQNSLTAQSINSEFQNAVNMFNGHNDGRYTWDNFKAKGTTTNDSATAGNIGEYMEAKSIAATFSNFPTTNQYGDAASLTITAGDWDVDLVLTAYINTGTWSDALAGISTTSGNSDTGLQLGHNMQRGRWANTATVIEMLPITVSNFRVSLAASTVYYAKVRAIYSAGQPTYMYRFSARRIR